MPRSIPCFFFVVLHIFEKRFLISKLLLLFTTEFSKKHVQPIHAAPEMQWNIAQLQQTRMG